MHGAVGTLVRVFLCGQPLGHQPVLSARVQQNDLPDFVTRRTLGLINQTQSSRVRDYDHKVYIGKAEEIVVQAHRPACVDGEPVQAEDLQR